MLVVLRTSFSARCINLREVERYQSTFIATILSQSSLSMVGGEMLIKTMASELFLIQLLDVSMQINNEETQFNH